MKALFIITRTNEMHKHIESWQCLGHSTTIYTYNHEKNAYKTGWAMGEKMEEQIYASAKDARPDIIVYVGADRGNLPTARFLRNLREKIAPTVLFCSDAGDPPWWDTLNTYDDMESFSVMVALDGNPDWPYHQKHLTLLTPLDPSYYGIPKPHAERGILFGFAGNPGGRILVDGQLVGRKGPIELLKNEGLVVRPRDTSEGNMDLAKSTYRECAQFMCDTRITPNIANTGSWTRLHVKGRVVEAGYAGCLLMETAGSPSRHWFERGVDYLEWADTGEAREILATYRDRPDESQAFGERLRKKVLAEHLPEHFWGKILERCR